MSKHIFRIQKNKNFVILDKRCLEDKRLSLKAKGLHCLMMAQSDEWVFYIDDIVDRSADGTKGVRAALNELREHGYLHRYAEYENGKIFRWVTDVYEHPQPTLCKPCGQRALSTLPFCTSRKATSRKTPPNKNNSNNNNKLNKNKIVVEPSKVVDNHQDKLQDVVLDDIVNVEEQTNEQIDKRLRKMANLGLITQQDCDRLAPEVKWHITHRPTRMTAQHALNAALTMIKKGTWSTPKKMQVKQPIPEWEIKYEQEKLKERQECVASALGKLLAKGMKNNV